MVYDKARELASEIRSSEEFKRYESARERIAEGSTTEALLKEFKKLQLRAQAAMVTGEEDDEANEKLMRLAGILQMDGDASEYLVAELTLSRMVGDIYKIIAEAAQLDLSMLE